MPNFRVEWSRKAEQDLDEITINILHHAPHTVVKWAERLMRSIEKLDVMPTRFAIFPQSRKYGVELREMVLGKRRGAIRVFFQIKRDLVYIVHIRRGSQGPIRVTDFEFLER